MNPEEQRCIGSLEGRTIAIDASSEPYQIHVLEVRGRQYPDQRVDITGQFLGPHVRDFVFKGVDCFDLIPERIDSFVAKLVSQIDIEETGRLEIDFGS